VRIAFYAPRASHLDLDLARGGDPIFLHALFAALAERGHEVRVVSRLNVRDLWRGRVPIWRLFAEALAIRRETRRFAPDAWLVYDPSRTYPDLFGWWQRPKRYVLLAAHTWQSASLPRGWRWLFAFAHRRSLARADRVVADRPISATRLLARGVAQERLSVLPPAVKVWTQLPSQEDARQQLGLPQDVAVILCVSRLTEPNDTEQKTEMVLDLLAASESLPPGARLVIVGDGPGRPRVEEEIVKLKLGDRVRMMGRVDDVKPYYAACDFYAYPLQRDRPWMSVLEAQGCGRPVVTMHTGSAEVTIDPGRTGLLAKDLDEFRSHLAALAGDRARCETMGQAAREYVMRCHSIETRAQQIETLLLKNS
jgi:glycosyltransferase involved in cell wall biosynthesis